MRRRQRRRRYRGLLKNGIIKYSYESASNFLFLFFSFSYSHYWNVLPVISVCYIETNVCFVLRCMQRQSLFGACLYETNAKKMHADKFISHNHNLFCTLISHTTRTTFVGLFVFFLICLFRFPLAVRLVCIALHGM